MAGSIDPLPLSRGRLSRRNKPQGLCSQYDSNHKQRKCVPQTELLFSREARPRNCAVPTKPQAPPTL